MRVGLIDESAPAGTNRDGADGEETPPKSLGWISVQTASGDYVLCNESRQQQSSQREDTSLHTEKPAQQQVTSPSTIHVTTSGTGSVVPNHTQQRVAARMARIDKLAEQKEIEYEWTQVVHQSGKSYWYANADYTVHG